MTPDKKAKAIDPKMKFVVDAKTGEIISESDAGAVANFMSWSRLAELLTSAGHLHNGEFVQAFVISDKGISIRIGRE